MIAQTNLCDIFVENQARRYKVSQKKVIAIVSAILQYLKLSRHGVNVLFVSDQKIVSYHWKYFQKRTATDVISFPWKAVSLRQKPDVFLGDLIISIDRAKYQARQLKLNFQEEVATYLIHGILHLIGHDDLHSKDKEKMFKVQDQILDKLVKNGYLKGKWIQEIKK